MMPHNLLLRLLLANVLHFSVGKVTSSAVAWLHRHISVRNLMVLHLLNYLLHVLTCVLQLCELLLEFQVEGFEGDDFLSRGHALDTC